MLCVSDVVSTCRFRRSWPKPKPKPVRAYGNRRDAKEANQTNAGILTNRAAVSRWRKTSANRLSRGPSVPTTSHTIAANPDRESNDGTVYGTPKLAHALRSRRLCEAFVVARRLDRRG